jgi:hypothetical protein
MNLPESPHQSAIAKASVPEVTGPFSKKVRPTLSPEAAEMVRIYESVPGALTYPGCFPEGLAAVLVHVAALRYGEVYDLAAMLRGEQP